MLFARAGEAARARLRLRPIRVFVFHSYLGLVSHPLKMNRVLKRATETATRALELSTSSERLETRQRPLCLQTSTREFLHSIHCTLGAGFCRARRGRRAPAARGASHTRAPRDRRQTPRNLPLEPRAPPPHARGLFFCCSSRVCFLERSSLVQTRARAESSSLWILLPRAHAPHTHKAAAGRSRG